MAVPEILAVRGIRAEALERAALICCEAPAQANS
jgi:hypothetical protein